VKVLILETADVPFYQYVIATTQAADLFFLKKNPTRTYVTFGRNLNSVRMVTNSLAEKIFRRLSVYTWNVGKEMPYEPVLRRSVRGKKNHQIKNKF